MSTSVSSPDGNAGTAGAPFAFPASFAQRRLWFIDQLEPGTAVYNIPGGVRVVGFLDLGALQNALNEIIQRHESLRTRFIAPSGEVRQVVEPGVSFELPVMDLCALPEETREEEALRLARQEARTPFDLGRAPLLRALLLKLAAQDHVLLVTMHHIVSDGWSIGIFLREISALYEAFRNNQSSPLPALPIQYVDFTVWQQKYLTDEFLLPQMEYWKKQLAGTPPALELPTDCPRPPLQSGSGSSIPFTIETEISEKIEELNRDCGTTMFMILLAAFNVLLYRYSNQIDICIGTPVAGRKRSQTEGLIGFFTNTLVIRTILSGKMSFLQLLEQTREKTLEAYANQDVPFEKLVEIVALQRDISRSPLFQVMLVLQNAPQSALHLGTAELQPFVVDYGISKFDLLLGLEAVASGIRGVLQYSTDLFERVTVVRMAEHYRMLLASIIERPQTPIAMLPILTQAEQRQLLVKWNRTEQDCPRKKCLTDLIEEQVAKTPNAIAVWAHGEKLTYAELNMRANQLAHYLRKRGIKPESRVCVCAQRRLNLLVVLLGVLKAGGAYVPLDPNYPPDRLAYMLADSQASALLLQPGDLASFPDWSGTVVDLDQTWKAIARESYEDLERLIFPENLAYVIYTSGSTGRPRGVAIQHSSVVAFTSWARRFFSPQELSGVLASTSISFDVSAVELYVPLTCGGAVILVENALDLAERLPAIPVRMITTVPSVMEELVQSKSIPDSVLAVGLAGEAVPVTLPRNIYEASQVERVLNLYGPTEDTTYSTFAHIERAQNNLVPIGRPIANSQAFVLDEEMQSVPVGVPGELHLGGMGLARGYLNQPEVTAQKFVPNPFSSQRGERLYKTGDRVRYLPDGGLDFLGRLDYQVKLRGFRIELGEIESALLEAGVQQAVVMVREDRPGDKLLVAYVISSLSAGELWEALKHRLPDYMIPAAFMNLTSLPLTPNGKVNRKALPAPDGATVPSYIPPQTPMEQELAAIWTEILGHDHIGVENDFFSLGGHSLLAVRMISRITTAFGIKLPLRQIFATSTIAGLAKAIAERAQAEISGDSSALQSHLHPSILKSAANGESASALVSIQAEGSNPPFFCVHPISGQVLCYANLARSLGPTQPFYGLQALAGDSGFEVPAGIPQMASLYCNEIRRVQAHGPYFLGGWSMGGLVAFEMARQLRKENEEVSLLALLDTHLPKDNRDGANGRSEASVMAAFAADISRLIGRDFSGVREKFLRSSPEEQRLLVQLELVREGILSPATASAELEELLNIFRHNLLAIDAYTPRPGDVQIVFFGAANGTPERLAAEWRRFATGGVELHSIAGDHYTILSNINVRPMAAVLRHYLVPVRQITEDQ